MELRDINRVLKTNYKKIEDVPVKDLLAAQIAICVLTENYESAEDQPEDTNGS